MCSYNPVNGVYTCENKHLLKDILRGKFGYTGLIISDWAGVKNSYKSLKAGMDLRMPADANAYNELKDAYDKGLITEEDVDSAVNQILEAIRSLDSMSNKHKLTHSNEERRTKSLDVAEESIVLLKNNGVLPIKSSSVCIIGDLNFNPYIGGGGAAEVKLSPAHNQLPLSELLGYNLGTNVRSTIKVRANEDGGDVSHNDREGALLASQHDVSVVLVGNGPKVDVEGKDRTSLRLREKDERLIKMVAATGTKTIVVLEAGSAIDMTNWIDDVDAVVFAGYLGGNTNESIANILSGKACPSGKLSETFPYCLEDTYCKDDTGYGNVEMYDDGLLVGYRYYDTKNIPVRFPFGFGLSYANFVYSDLQVEKTGETNFKVTFTVTNDSAVDGKEVSQVYIKDPVSTVFKPEKELKAFAKTLIKAGESKKVTIELDKSSFWHYDVTNGEKYVENGEFIIMIGSSSQDIRLQQRVSITLPDETQHSVF